MQARGLVQETVEETIASMGYVGRVGMQPTDVEILNLMIGKTRGIAPGRRPRYILRKRPRRCTAAECLL